MKISGFLISIVILGLFAAIFGMFYANIAQEYPVTYDNETNETIASFDKIQNITDRTTEIEEELFTQRSGLAGAVDLIGGFLGAGFDVLRLAKESVTTFVELVDTALSLEALGSSAGIFKAVFLAIVTIIIIFIIISAIIGRDV